MFGYYRDFSWIAITNLASETFLGIEEARFSEVFYERFTGPNPEFSYNFGKFCNICKCGRLGCFVFGEGTVLLEIEKCIATFVCVIPVLVMLAMAYFISSLQFFRPMRVPMIATVVERTGILH